MSDLKISEFTQATTIASGDFIGGHRGSNNLKWALSLVRSHSVATNSIPVASGADSFAASPLAVSGTKVTAAGAFDVSGLLRALNYLEVETIDNATGDFVTWSNSTKRVARRTAAQVRGDIGAEPVLTKGAITATGAISLSNSTRQAIGGALQISHSDTAGNRHLPSGGVGPSWLLFGHPSDSGRGQWIENEFAQNHYVFWSGSKFDYESSGLRNLSGGSVACDGFFTAGKLISNGDVIATEKLIATNTEIYKSGTHETTFKNSVSAYGQHNFVFEGDINALSLTIDSITDTSASITADPDRRLVYYNPTTGKLGASSGQSSLTLELGQLRTPDIRTATNTDLIMRRNNLERLRLTSGGVAVTGTVSGLSSLRIGGLALQAARTIQTQTDGLTNIVDCRVHGDGDHASGFSTTATSADGSASESNANIVSMVAYTANATGETLGVNRAKSSFLSVRPAAGGVFGVGTISAADVIFARNKIECLRLKNKEVTIAGAGVGVRMPYRVITAPNSPPVSYSYSGASATDAQIFIGGSQITVVEITETPQEPGSILTVINGRNVNIELNAYGNFGSPWYTIQPNCCMSFRRVPGGWSKVI